MPEQNPNTAQAKTPPATKKITFSVVTRKDIPKVVREGRASRYAPLYEKAKTLKQDEVLALPISKYRQVQAFRTKLEEMGLVVNVRKSEKGLTAYISHEEAETK